MFSVEVLGTQQGLGLSTVTQPVLKAKPFPPPIAPWEAPGVTGQVILLKEWN